MENENETPSSPQDSADSTPAGSAKEEPTARKELNVVSVPNDRDMIEQEMADLFEEDQVTHQHGSSEPEGD